MDGASMETGESCRIGTGRDLVAACLMTRRWAAGIGMSDVDATKLVTATSELARNLLIHGGGGYVTVETLRREGKVGIRLSFVDQGPGIADPEQAMRDGFSTTKTLGLGLPGARRLVDEFELKSAPGVGTRVVVIKWKRALQAG